MEIKWAVLLLYWEHESNMAKTKNPLYNQEDNQAPHLIMDGCVIFDLSGTFKDENVWIIDSGASRHMTGECSQLHTFSKGTSSHPIQIGDKKRYLTKGIASTSLELDSGGSIHLRNTLCVLGLKKNLFMFIF